MNREDGGQKQCNVSQWWKWKDVIENRMTVIIDGEYWLKPNESMDINWTKPANVAGNEYNENGVI